MELSDVQTILNDHTAGGTLTLPADAFGAGTPVAQLLTAYLTGSQLVVTGAVQVTTDTAVTVQGTGGNAPLTGMALNVRFSVADDGSAVLAAVATAPAGWTLATAFPVLAPTLAAGLTFTGTTAFYLASADTDLAARGLHFGGTLALDGALAPFQWMLGGASTLDVTGPVEIHQGVPEMAVGASVLSGVTLGYFRLRSVRLDVVSRLVAGLTGGAPGSGDGAPVAPTPAADACFRLSSEVSFQTQGTAVGIPIAAEFYDTPGSWIAFEADLNDVVTATLDALTSLVNGYPIGDLLASMAGVLEENVRLSTLVLQLDPSGPTLSSVSVGVRSARPWTLIQKTVDGQTVPVLAVNAVELIFRVFDPLDTAGWSGALFVFGQIAVEGALMDVTAQYPDFTVAGELGGSLDVADAVGFFLRQPVEDLPDIRITELGFAASPGAGSYSAAVEVESDWTLPIGPVDVVVRDVFASVDYADGAASGRLGGVLTVGSAEVAMDWALPGDLQLGGVIPSIDVTALVTQFASDALGSVAGAFPQVTLTDTQLYVARYQNGGYFVTAGTTVSGFGTFEVAFSQVQDRTGFVFGFALPAGWKLSALSASTFGALDFLTFQEASLVVASYSDPDFAFRQLDSIGTPVVIPHASGGVVAGMALHAEILLASGGPLSVLSKILPQSVTGLGLDVLIPTDYTATTLQARLNGAVTLLAVDAGTDEEVSITVQNLRLTLTPFEVEADLHLEVRFVLFGNAAAGTNTLVLAGDVEVSGAELYLRVATATPWVEPFGIKGLTLQAMGLSFGLGEEILLGLAGAVVLGTGSSVVTLEAGIEFNLTAEGVPDALKVYEAGTINLGDLIAAFVGSGAVPADLRQVELYEFLLVIVANPLGWTNPDDNHHYPPGFGFKGSLRFFGLVGDFALQVDYDTGIYASGVIKDPIRLGSAVTIASATDPTAGPAVVLNSAASPYLAMTVRLSFYEISARLVALVASGAFAFEFTFDVPNLASMAVRAALTNGNRFDFAADFTLTVPSLGPIRVSSTRTLGTLDIDLSLAAHVDITVGPGAIFKLHVSATFTLWGYHITLPDTKISGSLSSLAGLAGVFFDTLCSKLWTIGAALFQDADAFFEFVGHGLATLAEDIGAVLKKDYHAAVDEASRLLKGVASAMAYDISAVAAQLEAGYHAAAADVAKALRAAAYRAEDVATALYDTFQSAEEDIAQALRTAGYELGEIATALKNTFGWAADEVASFFKQAWHIADDVAHAALQAANYAKDVVESAMKTVFGWVTKAYTAVKDTLTDW